jgi:sulfide:quinone oxidoreductase
LAVVRNNLERSLQGQSLNAEYDGYTKVPILLGQNSVTFICHKYDNVNAWHNLYFSDGGLLSQVRYPNNSFIRYSLWVRGFKKAFMDIYLEKNWGPPYYRIKKTFKSTDGGHDGGFLSKFLPVKH